MVKTPPLGPRKEGERRLLQLHAEVLEVVPATFQARPHRHGPNSMGGETSLKWGPQPEMTPTVNKAGYQGTIIYNNEAS